MTVQGPAWDLSSEYPGPDSVEIETDLASLDELLGEIEQHGSGLDGDAAITTAQAINKRLIRATTLLRTLTVYASCLLSVDARHSTAQALQGTLKRYGKRMAIASEPLQQLLMRIDDASLARYFEDPDAADGEFVVRHRRKRRHELLSLEEETLASALAQDGIFAFGTLYTQLSGTLECEVPTGNTSTKMGISEAAGLLGSRAAIERESSWRAINAAWKVHEETCAASLNAIAGWRLEMLRRRSQPGQPSHFLDAPAHESRITRKTLASLMEAAEQARPLARRAARAQARAYGRERIGPWDIRSPAPAFSASAQGAAIEFDEAIETVANAYAEVDPSMGEFVRMMRDKRWIEGTVGPSKRPGAYCTGFVRSRTPRVYMSYTGRVSDVITLAHELGHAYHSWVMRDLPLSQTSYGMSLAETASIFGETLVRNALLARATSPAERLDIVWEELSALVAFVLNIPTRFEFEKRFYERREERPLRPDELSTLMSESWTHWYGDALEEPDPMFWASKLHFHISGLSFYNFPYLFGYLFSSGVYTRREAMGPDFFDRFNALLLDTGRMTAEEIAATHLQVDIEAPDFWTDTLDAMAPRIALFESLLDQVESST